MTERYVFRITDIVKVTDADSYWFRVDVGFRQTILANIRLLGYDAPERHQGSDHEKAQAKRAHVLATEFLESWAPMLWVRTEPDPDSFGRWLGDIWSEALDGTRRHLGAELRQHRLASIWPTRWREEFDV